MLHPRCPTGPHISRVSKYRLLCFQWPSGFLAFVRDSISEPLKLSRSRVHFSSLVHAQVFLLEIHGLFAVHSMGTAYGPTQLPSQHNAQFVSLVSFPSSKHQALQEAHCHTWLPWASVCYTHCCAHLSASPTRLCPLKCHVGS